MEIKLVPVNVNINIPLIKFTLIFFIITLLILFGHLQVLSRINVDLFHNDEQRSCLEVFTLKNLLEIYLNSQKH